MSGVGKSISFSAERTTPADCPENRIERAGGYDADGLAVHHNGITLFAGISLLYYMLGNGAHEAFLRHT